MNPKLSYFFREGTWFQKRLSDPTKRWKLSPMDLESRTKWVEYSKAKDIMFEHTDTDKSPWFVVKGDDKKRARLNCIHHLLSLVPYEDLTPGTMTLPARKKGSQYTRPALERQKFIPEIY